MTRAGRSVSEQSMWHDSVLPLLLWEICIPTLRLDADRTIKGCQIWVVPASRPGEARRVALRRAMAPQALRHRRNAELDVRGALVYAWRDTR